MLRDHIVDAESRRSFFARLREKDHIPVELDSGSAQHQHQHQRRRDIVLIVEGPATVHVTILGHRGEGIDGPVVGLHTDDIGVAHKQNRLFTAVATKPSNQIRARRVEREQFGLDALLLEYSLKIRCGFGFVAWRIARIRAQQGRKILHRFRGDGLPVHGITILCVCRERSC